MSVRNNTTEQLSTVIFPSMAVTNGLGHMFIRNGLSRVAPRPRDAVFGISSCLFFSVKRCCMVESVRI